MCVASSHDFKWSHFVEMVDQQNDHSKFYLSHLYIIFFLVTRLKTCTELIEK